jgi:hypothetical protein
MWPAVSRAQGPRNVWYATTLTGRCTVLAPPSSLHRTSTHISVHISSTRLEVSQERTAFDPMTSTKTSNKVPHDNATTSHLAPSDPKRVHPSLIGLNCFHEKLSISYSSVNEPNFNIFFDFHFMTHFTNRIQKVTKYDEKHWKLISLRHWQDGWLKWLSL